MTHEKHSPASTFGDILHLADGFLLEFGVADGEDLIDDEDLGFHEGGDGEAETDGHAAAVTLDRGVEVALHAGEVDNLVEFARDLMAGHAHDAAIHVDVLATGHLGVETGADFEQ